MIHVTPLNLKDKSFIRTAHLLPRVKRAIFVVALESFSTSMLLWINLCVFVSGQGFHNIYYVFTFENVKLFCTFKHSIQTNSLCFEAIYTYLISLLWYPCKL